MFSGLRSLIFGSYEENASLSTLQPDITAAQLLPSLEDQQREEEERLLRERQPIDDRENALEESQPLSDLINIEEDTWELVDFDNEQSSQKIVLVEETSLIIEKETVLNLSEISESIVNKNDCAEWQEAEDAKDSGSDSKGRTAQRNENQTKVQRKLNVASKPKAKGYAKIIDQKQISRPSSPATTSEFAVSSIVAKTSIANEQVEKPKVVSPLIVRPTLSFAAIAAKNNPSLATGPSASSKQSSLVATSVKVEPCDSSSSVTKVSSPSAAGLKRQRPISSSSWSSQNDLNDPIIADSDDESIDYSDFSDCDFDHGYNHNHLTKGLKSKQSNRHKAKRDYIVSKCVGEKFAILEDSTKNGSKGRKNQHQHLTKFNTKNFGKINERSTRNKKKKLINESIISPKASALNTVQEPITCAMKVACDSKEASQVSKAQPCMGPPPPPPPPPTTTSNSGNDSSDAAEMDESWFVTPPSCFDGCKSPKRVLKNAQKQTGYTQSTTGENAKRKNPKLAKSHKNDPTYSPKNLSPESTDFNHRSSSSTELENLLIEHPSMYIPRPTRGNQQQRLNQDRSDYQKIYHAGNQSLETKLEKPERNNEDSSTAKVDNENRAPARTVTAIQLLDDHLPYWQKKKKRQKRRSQARTQKMSSKNCSPCSGRISLCSSVSEGSASEASTSSLSSAGIINRIGSTIVANITNLTSTLPNVQNVRGIAEEMKKFAETVEKGFERSRMEHKLTAQRKLAKSIMAKQNKRVAPDNGHKRVGRRTKMFTRANGYSIDRKN